MPKTRVRSTESNSRYSPLSTAEKASQRGFWKAFSGYMADEKNFIAPLPVTMLLMATAPSVPKEALPAIERRLKELLKLEETCKTPTRKTASRTGSDVQSVQVGSSTSGKERKTTSAGGAGTSSKPTAIDAILGPLMSDIQKKRKSAGVEKQHKRK